MDRRDFLSTGAAQAAKLAALPQMAQAQAQAQAQAEAQTQAHGGSRYRQLCRA